MSKLAALTSGTGVTVGAGAAVVVAVVAAFYGGVFSPESEPEVTVPAALVAPEASEGDVAVKPASKEAPAEAAPARDPVADVPSAPTFDVVRVDEDGTTMVAGTAEANSRVEIRLDDAVVGEVTAGENGKFAGFVDLPQSAEPRVLTLDADVGGAGEEQVIVAPVQVAGENIVVAAVDPAEEVAPPTVDEATGTQEVAEPAEAEIKVPAVVVAETGAEPAEEPAAVPTGDAEDTPVDAPSETVAEGTGDAPAAPAVLLASKDGVRVLQSPSSRKPEAMTALLGSISYDDAGEVALTGVAAGSFVRVYLDNAPITTSKIEADGNWRVGLPSVDMGIYTLRVDELNDAGDVVARVETPFKREAAEVLEAAVVPDKPVQALTVQPGATLWAIARDRYGDGRLYTRVFEANADAIRDPDLIYPGQVFAIPNE